MDWKTIDANLTQPKSQNKSSTQSNPSTQKKKSTQDVKLDGVGFVGLVDWKQIPIRDNMR